MNAAAPSSRRVWRILLVLALVVGGLSIYGQWGLEEAVGTPEPGLAAAVAPEANLAPAIPAFEGADELTERLEQPLPTLLVTAVNPDGDAIPEAAITVSGPIGQKFEAVGAGVWADLQTGDWFASAEAEGYFPAEKGINLRRGKEGELNVEMRPAAQVKGTILTTYGKPMVAARIYFLKEGEELPRLTRDGDDLPQCRPKRGQFLSPPLTGGSYRVVCRAPGRGVIESPPATLVEGRVRHAEILIDRGGMLRVDLEGGLNLAGKQGIVRLILKEVRKRPRRNEAGQIEESEVVRWRPEEHVRFKGDQPVSFDRVRPGEYRLRVEGAGIGRYQSADSFVVGGLEAMVVRVILPGSPPAEDDRTVKPVPIEVFVNPTDMPTKKEAGVRWID